MAENVNSILSSGGDYSTLAAWEADTDVALTAGTHEVAEIGESETIEEGATSLTIAGATGFGTAQHRIIRSSGAAYDPATDTGPVVRFTAGLSRIDAQGTEDYIELRDFCFFLDTTSNQTSQRHIIDTRGEGQITANVTVKRTTASTANTAGGRAIYCRGRNGVIASCYNCTVIGNGANTGLLIGILNNFDANIYNCVAYNCSEVGINSASVGEVLENCIAMDNGTDFSVSFTVMSNCLSSDTTATGTASHISETTANIFTNAAGSDFSLVSGSNAHEGGKTQTVFTTDRAGVSRPQGPAWDMGVLELVSVFTVEQTVVDSPNDNTTIAAIAYSSDNTAGSLLLYYIHGWDTTASDNWVLSGITDTQSNTWQKAYSNDDAGGANNAEIWYAMDCSAGANTVTAVSTGGGGLYYSQAIQEVSGAATTSALDTGGGNGAGTGSPTVTAGAESSQADTFLATVCNQEVTGAASWTLPSGYTAIYEEADNNSPDFHQPGFAAYKVETVAATETAASSRSPNDGTYNAVIAVFTAPVSIPATATPGVLALTLSDEDPANQVDSTTDPNTSQNLTFVLQAEPPPSGDGVALPNQLSLELVQEPCSWVYAVDHTCVPPCSYSNPCTSLKVHEHRSFKRQRHRSEKVVTT